MTFGTAVDGIASSAKTTAPGMVSKRTPDSVSLMDVRMFDEGEMWAAQGCLSCAHWLNWRCGIGLGAAREKVRVARALGGLPLIDEALRLGTRMRAW